MAFAGEKSSNISGKQCYAVKITKSTDNFFSRAHLGRDPNELSHSSSVLLSMLGGALSVPCSSSEPRSNLPQPWQTLLHPKSTAFIHSRMNCSLHAFSAPLPVIPILWSFRYENLRSSFPSFLLSCRFLISVFCVFLTEQFLEFLGSLPMARICTSPIPDPGQC